MFKTLLFTAALGLAQAFSASAATMTFADLPGFFPGDRVYEEDGITARLNNFQGSATPGSAHMDDGGTGFSSSINFSMSGLFDAVSFDILPLLPINFCADFACSSGPQTFDNVHVQGFRSGALIAEDLFFMGASDNTHSFGSAYSMLDELVISIVFPDPAVVTGVCFSVPCTHFNLDNLKLAAIAPVPLPAAAPLLAGGLIAMGWYGRRRRKKAAASA